jgi:hypothetical protein
MVPRVGGDAGAGAGACGFCCCKQTLRMWETVWWKLEAAWWHLAFFCRCCPLRHIASGTSRAVRRSILHSIKAADKSWIHRGVPKLLCSRRVGRSSLGPCVLWLLRNVASALALPWLLEGPNFRSVPLCALTAVIPMRVVCCSLSAIVRTGPLVLCLEGIAVSGHAPGSKLCSPSEGCKCCTASCSRAELLGGWWAQGRAALALLVLRWKPCMGGAQVAPNASAGATCVNA